VRWVEQSVWRVQHSGAEHGADAGSDSIANGLSDAGSDALLLSIASAEVCCSIRFHASSWHVETTVGTRRDECGCEGFAPCIQPDADSIANRFELTDCRADDRCAP
jgi:hypothetical protein